jgi:transposase
MSRNLFWLTDDQWTNIEPFLPTDVRGKPRVDDRRVISGIPHVLKNGCRWCDCPVEYGSTRTIYNRFVRWTKRIHTPSDAAKFTQAVIVFWIFWSRQFHGSSPCRR